MQTKEEAEVYLKSLPANLSHSFNDLLLSIYQSVYALRLIHPESGDKDLLNSIRMTLPALDIQDELICVQTMNLALEDYSKQLFNPRIYKVPSAKGFGRHHAEV